MEAFVAVANLRSFTKAATLLNMSQSALSQAIAQVELILATQLIERTKRVVKLTAAGAHFLPRAERVLVTLQSAAADVRSGFDPRQGSISIACVSLVATRVLPAAISRYRTEYPNSSVLVRDDYPDRVLNALRTGEADFAVSTLASPEPGLSMYPLLEEKFYFICPRSHPLGRRQRIKWADLSGLDFVGMPRGSSIRASIDSALVGAGVSQELVYQVGRVTSVVEIVAQGGGVSVVPALALADSRIREDIHMCLMSSPEVKRTIGLIKVADAPLSATASNFQKILLATLRQKSLDRNPGVKTLVK